jgi:pimeloyl-ACP methyl ester carboxylesterase
MTTTTSPGLSGEIEEGFCDASGVRIHYCAAGSGSPVICLHGGGPGATGMGNFRRNFRALASSFRTIVIDLPQFGQSDKPVIAERLLAFNARVLNDFMAALGVAKAAFVGNSLGGGTAAKVAIDYPDRVTSLVLMGPSGHGPSLFVPPPTEGIRKLRSYYRDPTRSRMRDFLETFVADPSLITDELLDERFENSIRPEILELQRTAQPPRSEDLILELKKIEVPTLLIWGREERFVPLDHALSFARNIPNATLIVVPNCGHWVQYENPQVFNDVTVRFLMNQPAWS